VDLAQAMAQGLLHPGGWGVFCSDLLSNGRDHHTTDDHNHLAPWKAHCRILDPGLANKNFLAFGAIHSTAGDSSRLIGFCPGSGAMPWRRDGEAQTQTQLQSPINDRGTEPLGSLSGEPFMQ
jgi:hypothetical protein